MFEMPPGSLSFALLTLGNVDFAAKTVRPKSKGAYEVKSTTKQDWMHH